MILKEIGSYNYKMWIDEVIRVCSLDSLYDTKNHSQFQDDAIKIPFNGVYVTIYVYFDMDMYCTINASEFASDNACTISYSDNYKVRNHHCVFQLDTEGIKILFEVIKKNSPKDKPGFVNAFLETDELYREKFRGKLTGDKFGF